MEVQDKPMTLGDWADEHEIEESVVRQIEEAGFDLRATVSALDEDVVLLRGLGDDNQGYDWNGGDRWVSARVGNRTVIWVEYGFCSGESKLEFYDGAVSLVELIKDEMSGWTTDEYPSPKWALDSGRAGGDIPEG